MKHLISSEQFTAGLLHELFVLADQMKSHPRDFDDILKHKVVATLFYEPSTRTRLSFESAVQRLGAKLISTENAREMSSAIKGENILDSIRVVQGYCDAIILRHYENDAARKATEVASVPIINAGGGTGEHPTQALLDLYTIYSFKQKISGSKVAVLGDLKNGRTIHSLIKSLSLYDDIEIYGFSRIGLEMPAEYISYLNSRQVSYHAVSSFEEIPGTVDVLYHTRTQTERISDEKVSSGEIIIDREVMKRFSDATLLMHPLPRNQEIAQEVDFDPRAIYFKQSENGLFIRMALLTSLLGATVGR
ncbi:aspartate carbamoyltransferase [Paenibacillus medicaginis]|uniref:Aspartate carbamoyltransferase n=1 Tax=Paenibacillus medicaginis TaxID=1470560 RepID=A0ABV5C4E3_9BACL